MCRCVCVRLTQRRMVPPQSRWPLLEMTTSALCTAMCSRQSVSCFLPLFENTGYESRRRGAGVGRVYNHNHNLK